MKPKPGGPQGRRLYRARTAAGLTQAQAAKLAEVHPNTWARWERGELRVNRWALAGILAELEKRGKR